MNRLLNAIEYIDDGLWEEFVNVDLKLEKSAEMRAKALRSRLSLMAATAACAVLVLGAALSIPKFISPGINDPSVPPVVSTEGEDDPGPEGFQPEFIAYSSAKEYNLTDDYAEITIYYGWMDPIDEYVIKYDYVSLFVKSGEKKLELKRILPEEFKLEEYKINYTQLIKTDENGEFFEPNFTFDEWKDINEIIDMKHIVRFNHCETINIPINMFTDNDTVVVGWQLNNANGYLPEGEYVSMKILYEIKDDKVVIHNTESLYANYRGTIIWEK